MGLLEDLLHQAVFFPQMHTFRLLITGCHTCRILSSMLKNCQGIEQQLIGMRISIRK